LVLKDVRCTLLYASMYHRYDSCRLGIHNMLFLKSK